MEPDPKVVAELQLELISSGFSRDPQPTYARLREQAPVLPSEGGVMLCRHADVEHALRHPEIFSSEWTEGMSIGNQRPLIPLMIDPPAHKNYRKLLDPLFAPREVARLEADVVKLCHELIDEFFDRGRCDFNAELAVPLPTTVFLRLLGLPLEDRDLFLEWKDAIIRGGGEWELDKAQEVRSAAGGDVYAYFGRELDEREQRRRDDLLSGFLDAEVDGHALTREEILDICFLLLIAGLDTVTDALDCSFAFLAQHPAHRRQIVEDPAVIPSAVEELLRWETPVPSIARYAALDTEVRGCPIHAGDAVGIGLGAANTDPDAFERADEIDFAREPNKHLAFGGGVHRCLGSHLARLELRVALREWHLRIPDYRLAPGVELEYTPALRQVVELPLVFG